MANACLLCSIACARWWSISSNIIAPCVLALIWKVLLLLFAFSVRPWDPMTDVIEYEHEGIIKTKYRMRAPKLRASSHIDPETDGSKKADAAQSKRPSSTRSRLGAPKISRKESSERSGASTPDPGAESSSVEDEDEQGMDLATLEKALQPLRDLQKESIQQMRAIRSDLRRHYSSHQDELAALQFKDWVLLLLLVVAQGVFQWYFRWRGPAPLCFCRLLAIVAQHRKRGGWGGDWRRGDAKKIRTTISNR